MTMHRLTDFKALTFDCYGTLIDWESGIHQALQPLLTAGGLDIERDDALATFGRIETDQQAETPDMIYSDLLAVVHDRLASEWGVAATSADHERFGKSVPNWPAFDDSTEALEYLGGHYKLVILSNVDRESFAASNRRLGVTFDAVYTAEDVGSYKPDPRNFDYMLAHIGELGVGKRDILHTAQSLYHDHMRATEYGLATAWIDRRHDNAGWGATAPPPTDVKTDFRFDSMADMARAHRQASGG